jgi:multidrug resistance protein, MATE family
MAASRPYVTDTLRLAGPVALARLGIIGMALADVIVVGQLAPKELPHQAMGWAPTAVFLVAGIGLLQGVQVLAARAQGEGNPQGAGVALWRGLLLALAAGLVSALALWLAGAGMFNLFGIEARLARAATPVMIILAFSLPLHLAYVAATFFMEAIKKPGISMAVMWGANIVNLALNLLWVPDLALPPPQGAEPLYAALREWPLLNALNGLTPEHGAIGSAWATVCARVFLAGALLLWIALLPDRANYGVRVRGANGPSYGALLAIGAAAAVSQAVEAGAFSAMTMIAGRLGEEVVAGYQLLLNLMALVFMVALGMAAATAVLVAEASGRGAPKDAARAGWTGVGLNAIAMLLAALVIFIFAGPISRFYTSDVSLAALIASLMWICALVLLPDGGQVVAASALRARGDNWFPTWSHIFAYAVLMPALGYWLAEHQAMGVAGLLFAIFWASVASAGVLVWRWWALMRDADPPPREGRGQGVG